MKAKFERTKCTVKLQKSIHHDEEYYVMVEAYPVYSEDSDKPQRQIFSLKRVISTPLWDKKRPTRSGNYQPKRNAEGVIQCRSKVDQDACQFAHKYCQMQQLDFDNKALFPEQYKQKHQTEQNAKKDFIEYIENHIRRRRPIVGNSCTRQWEIMLKRLKDFAGNKKLFFGNLTPLRANQFREYLMTHTNDKGKALAPNSQKLYLAHFKAALYQAYKEQILPTDISINIDPIKGEQTMRQYLTQQELQQVADTPCDDDETRRAALFSALTGFRYVDISQLTWDKISRDETDIPRIQLRQQKTKGVMYHDISQQALALCGERKESQSLVFKTLAANDNINDIIRNWVKRAGVVNKDITFHCFRHTYATLQLEGGTDLFVVSKLLGHTDVKTTQIYLHMTDKQKQTATTAINLNIKQP